MKSRLLSPGFLFMALPFMMGSAFTQETPGKKVADASNQFALDMYGALKVENGNIIYSPMSLHVLLSLIHEGAEGDTLKELQTALHWGELEKKDRHEEILALRSALAPKRGTQIQAQSQAQHWMQVGQYMWLSEQRWIRPTFMKTAEEVYGVSPQAMDFTKPPQAIREINAAIARYTNQRIPSLLQDGSVNAETNMLVASTIFFRGLWQFPFDARKSKRADFLTMAPGVNKPVIMMEQQVSTRGFVNDSWLAVEMPFAGSLHEYSMWLFLPKQRGALAQMEDQLSNDLLTQIITESRVRDVTLKMPRFSFSMGGNYQSILGQLGIKRIFDRGNAELKGISPEPPPFIGSLLHEASIEINEIGGEMAAATSAAVEPFGPAPEPEGQHTPMIFIADHPFVFVVRHKTQGLITFMGRVAAP